MHAQLEPVGRDRALADDGLSRNGTYVNGERVTGRRRLRDGDRLCFGETAVLFRAPAGEASVSTAVVGLGHGSVPVTDTQRRLLAGQVSDLRENVQLMAAGLEEAFAETRALKV